MSHHDIIEITQLNFRYAAAVDACDVAALQAVFASDARLRSYHPDTQEPFAEMVGHAALASVPNTMRTMFRRTTHMMTNHLIEVTGDKACGTVLCTARHLGMDSADLTSMNVIIRYIDQYARTHGVWYIAEREIHFLWSERHDITDSGFG